MRAKYISIVGMMAAVIIVVLMALTGCSEADKVSYNVSKQADNFNVNRRLTAKGVSTKSIMYILTKTQCTPLRM